MSEAPALYDGLPKTLTLASAKLLAESGAIRSIVLIAQADRFVMAIRHGASERLLERQRGGIREFKSIDHTLRMIRDELKLTRFEVDIHNLSD